MSQIVEADAGQGGLGNEPVPIDRQRIRLQRQAILAGANEVSAVWGAAPRRKRSWACLRRWARNSSITVTEMATVRPLPDFRLLVTDARLGLFGTLDNRKLGGVQINTAPAKGRYFTTAQAAEHGENKREQTFAFPAKLRSIPPSEVNRMSSSGCVDLRGADGIGGITTSISHRTASMRRLENGVHVVDGSGRQAPQGRSCDLPLEPWNRLPILPADHRGGSCRRASG